MSEPEVKLTVNLFDLSYPISVFFVIVRFMFNSGDVYVEFFQIAAAA